MLVTRILAYGIWRRLLILPDTCRSGFGYVDSCRYLGLVLTNAIQIDVDCSPLVWNFICKLHTDLIVRCKKPILHSVPRVSRGKPTVRLVQHSPSLIRFNDSLYTEDS
jgi:hypothetical protein